MTKTPGKKLPVNRSLLIFSSVLLVIIFLVTFTVYTIVARQINLSFVEQQLAIASDNTRLRLAMTVNSELSLVLKMADTPFIKQHFLNPSDSAIKSLAYAELSIFEQHFNDKLVFWINDVDKIFYSTGNDPYVVNPDDPDTYWYNMTLNETQKYNFNINYNPDIGQIYLWVNVPVTIENEGIKKPIGMLGAGINLTEFSEFIASGFVEFDKNIKPFLFNRFNEITCAADSQLARDKIRLDSHLGKTGDEIIKAASTISGNESLSFISGGNMYMVSSIPLMEWHLVLSYPMPGLLALNQNMNIQFFSMLVVIFLLFVVMNVFVSRSEATIARQNIKLIEVSREARAASRAKSDFLVKMSHEIRTPMNAIMGMAELLLRGELSNEARSRALDIKQAGNNLISLINDILDLSKIESGKLEIINSKYHISSLINDTVSIIRVRLIERPIRYYTNIDGNIPGSLIGDETRLRQIILNLLSNAIKYTNEGRISLVVTQQKREGNRVWLKIVVSDTGRGIKREDQDAIFGEFVQVDTLNNRGIEGTGLGLSITKRLCQAMDGEIFFESEYGKGSSFTVIVPQEIDSDKPFALVEKPEEKRVLVFERRADYAKAIAWSLENLGVPHRVVEEEGAFREALLQEEWYYAFSGYSLYEKIKPLMESPDSIFPNARKPPLALIVEWGFEARVPNTLFVSMPVQSMSIANILNGIPDTGNFCGTFDSFSVIKFSLPNVRILVVDDFATNLKVAEGLLTPYNAYVETCLSGERAIELLKSEDFDIVFLDHMMPEMDGVETVSRVRDLEKNKKSDLKTRIPIVALTANTVVGMREFFLKNGFDDFLAKPIDVTILNEILDKWIPEEKKEKLKSADMPDSNSRRDNQSRDPRREYPLIDGVDIQYGVMMTGGTIEKYRSILKVFVNSIEERLPVIQTRVEKENLDAFTINIHAIKSSCAVIGAKSLSKKADRLETAARNAELDFLEKNTGEFIPLLDDLVKKIREAEIAYNEEE